MDTPPPVSQKDGERWQFLLLGLKSDLASIPAHVARRFAKVKPDEEDFDACFRAWWLERVARGPEGLTLCVGAADAETTRAGIAKYEKRLERLARTYFRPDPNKPVRFKVLESPGA